MVTVILYFGASDCRVAASIVFKLIKVPTAVFASLPSSNVRKDCKEKESAVAVVVDTEYAKVVYDKPYPNGTTAVPEENKDN